MKWCAMHVLNLGVCLLSTGSTISVLVNKYKHIWGGEGDVSAQDRLAIAYELFRKWTRENRIAYLGTYVWGKIERKSNP